MEKDIHIWKEPESTKLVALYTISVGKRAICIDLPISAALECLQEYMEEM